MVPLQHLTWAKKKSIVVIAAFVSVLPLHFPFTPLGVCWGFFLWPQRTGTSFPPVHLVSCLGLFFFFFGLVCVSFLRGGRLVVKPLLGCPMLETGCGAAQSGEGRKARTAVLRGSEAVCKCFLV